MVDKKESSRYSIVTATKLSSSNSMLVHEHDFVSAEFRNTTHCIIHCLTCKAYFCSLCGKMLNNSIQ
jgi:hypothetical protein